LIKKHRCHTNEALGFCCQKNLGCGSTPRRTWPTADWMRIRSGYFPNGSGTSTNMNATGLRIERANFSVQARDKLAHPNDHVNVANPAMMYSNGNYLRHWRGWR